MKIIWNMLILLLVSCNLGIAQDSTKKMSEKITIEVTESKEKMSQGVYNAIKTYIPEGNKSTAERNFAKYMKSHGAKADSKRGEYFFDNVSLKEFGNEVVDVYSITEQKSGGVELKVFFDLGGGAFLNSLDHPAQYKAAEDFVRKFARDEATATVGQEITNAQKKLDSKIKKYDYLIREDSSLSKKIRNAEALIKQAHIDQKETRANQQKMMEEIQQEQKNMEFLKSKQAGIE